MDVDWRVISTALMIATAIPIVGFVLNYFFRFQWYKNVGGWNLLLFMAVVGEFLVLAIYVRVTGHRFPDWFASLLWVQLAPLAWWRLLILVDVEYKQRRQKRKAKQDGP